MIILVILLWSASAILFLTNPKSVKTRWGSLIAFFGGCGGLGAVLGRGSERPDWMLILDGLLTSFGHYLTPYAILIFGIVYSDLIKTQHIQRLLTILSFIPVVIMYSLFQEYPEFKTNFDLLSIWVVPYVVLSNAMLIYSTYCETNPSVKKQRISTCLVVIPAISFACFTNIILESLGIVGVWMYNPLIIIITFFLFSFFAAKYGFLGVHIKFEKQRRSSTIKAATSGTALLNHTLKNEIAKIDFLANQLKDQLPTEKDSYESINLMLRSTNHVLEISKRIQSKLDIIDFKESEFWLSDIVHSVISLLQPYLSSEINIIKQYEVDVKIYGDPVHIKETFLNITKNAIEAMDNKGSLLILISKNRRNVCIDFKDNGGGIEKDKLPLLMDPFYSTKEKKGNYGLGLTYCYNVMEKHGGKILIRSQVNKGTIVTLSLPAKRIIDIKIMQQSHSKTLGEKVYEYN